MARKRQRAENAGASMDLTPMIDVVFLLVIFFLCLEFKSLEGRLAANLPKDIGPNPTPAEPIEMLDIRISTIDRGRKVTDELHPHRYELVNHSCQWQVGA
ncbi:MAG: ExbD/TolR family protein, partial [Planctomycetota bacterium]